jgi:hypothetical protein
MFSPEGGLSAENCTRDYLPPRFKPCAIKIQNNESAEDILDCFKVKIGYINDQLF